MKGRGKANQNKIMTKESLLGIIEEIQIKLTALKAEVEKEEETA